MSGMLMLAICLKLLFFCSLIKAALQMEKVEVGTKNEAFDDELPSYEPPAYIRKI